MIARKPIQSGLALLVSLTLVHALVDTFATSVQPLWPELQKKLGLGDGSIQWVVVGWSLTTSVSQLLFGYLGDRHASRWLLWVGPFVGVLGMGLIGLADSVWMLLAMVVLGGLGVAAFHPEAAAVAGSAMPEDRARGMSIFVTGGFLGQSLGPLGSGEIAERFGLAALAWNLAWGLPLLVALRPHRLASPDESAPDHRHEPVSIRWLLAHRGRELGSLFVAGLFRVLPAAGTPLALAFWLDHNGAGKDVIGLNQSAFYLGVGLGGFACALVIRRSLEHRMLWFLPLLSVPVLAAIPRVGASAALGCSFGVGGIVGLGLPVFTSYGQRLLPEGQRIASSITMGVTWGAGGVIVAGLMAACTRWGRPDLPFALFSIAAVGAAIACVALPEPRALRPRDGAPVSDGPAEAAVGRPS